MLLPSLLLDRMVSESIDVGFFRNDVPREATMLRMSGTHEILRMGSLRLLADWRLDEASIGRGLF